MFYVYFTENEIENFHIFWNGKWKKRNGIILLADIKWDKKENIGIFLS